MIEQIKNIGHEVRIIDGEKDLVELWTKDTKPMDNVIFINIDEGERGKILGGIDTILLLSPSIGIAIGTKLIAVDYSLAVFYLAVVFGAGLLMVVFNKNINCVRM